MFVRYSRTKSFFCSLFANNKNPNKIRSIMGIATRIWTYTNFYSILKTELIQKKYPNPTFASQLHHYSSCKLLEECILKNPVSHILKLKIFLGGTFFLLIKNDFLLSANNGRKNATLLKLSGFPLFQILGRKLPFHPLLNSQFSRRKKKY